MARTATIKKHDDSQWQGNWLDEKTFVIDAPEGRKSFCFTIREVDLVVFREGEELENGLLSPEKEGAALELAAEKVRELYQADGIDFESDESCVTVSLSRVEIDERAMEDKYCEYQRSEKRQLLCDIKADDKPERTKVVCNACTLPVTSTLCSNLINPTTLTEGTLASRQVISRSDCNVGKNAGSGEQCKPGGNKDCWMLEVTKPTPNYELYPDIADRVLTELDFINSVTRTGKRPKFFKAEAFESVGDITKSPTGKEELAQCVAALGTVIDGISVEQFVAEEHRNKFDEHLEKEKDKGSLNQLQIYLELNNVNDSEEIVKKFRRLRHVRAGLVHTKNDRFYSALSAIGVAVPVVNNAIAWQQCLAYFHAALHQLRKDALEGIFQDEN